MCYKFLQRFIIVLKILFHKNYRMRLGNYFLTTFGPFMAILALNCHNSYNILKSITIYENGMCVCVCGCCPPFPAGIGLCFVCVNFVFNIWLPALVNICHNGPI